MSNLHKRSPGGGVAFGSRRGHVTRWWRTKLELYADCCRTADRIEDFIVRANTGYDRIVSFSVGTRKNMIPQSWRIDAWSEDTLEMQEPATKHDEHSMRWNGREELLKIEILTWKLIAGLGWKIHGNNSVRRAKAGKKSRTVLIWWLANWNNISKRQRRELTFLDENKTSSSHLLCHLQPSIARNNAIHRYSIGHVVNRTCVLRWLVSKELDTRLKHAPSSWSFVEDEVVVAVQNGHISAERTGIWFLRTWPCRYKIDLPRHLYLWYYFEKLHRRTMTC